MRHSSGLWQKGAWALIAYWCGSTGLARAELVIHVPNESVLIDFQDFAGGGLQPGGGSGTLDSNDWSIEFFDFVDGFSSLASDFGATNTSGSFAGGVVAGSLPGRGLYAVNTGGGNLAMGVQTGVINGGSPGAFAGTDPILRIQNQSGVVFDGLIVDYDLWVFNNSDESLYVDLEALGSSATIGFDDSLNGVPGFETEVTASENPQWTKYAESNDLFFPASVFEFGPEIDLIEDGETIDLRWSIGGTSDSLSEFDGVAIDNIRITGVNFATAIPEPGVSVLLAAMCTGAMMISRRRRSAV